MGPLRQSVVGRGEKPQRAQMKADRLAEQIAPDENSKGSEERKKGDLRVPWAKSPLLRVPRQRLQRSWKPHLLDQSELHPGDDASG